ncbi:MAG: hypothetical protein R3C19_00300 [Planctomycetaceae bacterium]
MLKRNLLTVLLLWATLVAERARPDVLPAGSIFFPAVVAGMLWFRSSSGLLIGGVMLIIDWITRPTPAPVVPVFLTVAATVLLASDADVNEFSERRSLVQRIPEWLRPALLTAAALVAYRATNAWATTFDAASIVRCAAISLPLSLLLGIVFRAADDFGLRRRADTMRF